MAVKTKIGDFVADAGKKAGEFFDKSKEKMVSNLDQNDDGKFDLSDVGAMAESVGDAFKEKVATIRQNAEERSRQQEYKRLQPVLKEDLESPDFALPKLIRIEERSGEYLENEICKDSIGHYTSGKDFRLLTVFADTLESLRLSFEPASSNGFYYVNPYDRDQYFLLDDYFNHLKNKQVNELLYIAERLGAKSLKVCSTEIAKESEKRKGIIQTKAAKQGAEVSAESGTKQAASLKIEASFIAKGHEPKKPEVYYLKNNPDVSNIVEMRMNRSSISHFAYSIQLSQTYGIQKSEAAKVDAVLEGVKVGGNAKFSDELAKESLSVLQYEIDF